MYSVAVLLTCVTRAAWIEYKAYGTVLCQLSNDDHDFVATRRERRANLQRLRTLLQTTPGTHGSPPRSLVHFLHVPQQSWITFPQLQNTTRVRCVILRDVTVA